MRTDLKTSALCVQQSDSLESKSVLLPLDLGWDQATTEIPLHVTASGTLLRVLNFQRGSLVMPLKL